MTANLRLIEPSAPPSSAEAFYIDGDDISDVGWETYGRLIAPAIDTQSEQTLEQLLTAIRERTMQAWVLAEPDDQEVVGAIATRITTYESDLKACLVCYAACEDTRFKADAWRSILATIEVFAKANGCDIVRVLGRPGWKRILPHYTMSSICLDKTIQRGD